MNFANKPVWSEGLFMRPQHFQQLERYAESAIAHKVNQIDPLQFGFLSYAFDEAELRLGRIRLAKAKGTFEDGQPFDLPTMGELPTGLGATQSETSKVFGLCVPLTARGQAEVELSSDQFDAFGNIRTRSDTDIPSRFKSAETDAWDTTVSDNGEQVIQVAQLTCILRWADQDNSSFSFLPLGRVRSVTAEGSITLDEDFIPTSISASASPLLSRLASDFAGVVEQQARALASRISSPGQSGVADVSDFMRLVSLNRIGTDFRIVGAVNGTHPRDLYRMLACAIAELATYSKAFDEKGGIDRLPPEMLPYDHRHPTPSFMLAQGYLNQLLTQQSESASSPIQLKKSAANGFSALLQDATYYDNRDLILAVKADVSESMLRDSFPAQVKLGPKEKMRELIAYQVPGIRLDYLSVVPRQLPYHAGFSYFKVERGTELWRQMLNSRQLELYVGGRFPGMELELWAVRG